MLPQIQIRQLKPSSIHPYKWGALTWYANRELGNCDEMTVGRCVLKPGQSNARHHHPNSTEILVVFKGRIAHTDERGDETQLQVVDAVTIPP
jgi:quercetin dioxygenase-like cupin family protein